MTGKSARSLVGKFVFLMLLNAGLLSAQTGPYDSEDQQDDAVVDQRNPQDDTSSQIPAGGRSLRDSVTQNPRNPVGFS